MHPERVRTEVGVVCKIYSVFFSRSVAFFLAPTHFQRSFLLFLFALTAS